MHIPVLKKEVLHYLDPKPNENFIDCTAGEGGHLFEIIERTGPRGKVLGIDRDEENIKALEKKIKNSRLENRIFLARGNYSNIACIVEDNGFRDVSGVLFDLGMSSRHIDESGRGFSFLRDEFLDMRYSKEEEGATAWEAVNKWPKESLEMIFKDYGEERFSKRIAEAIAVRRKEKTIDTTSELVEVIGSAVPERFRKGRIHFATRVFQALRIAVNEELENLKEALPEAAGITEKGGRIVVISFHSLEDRIVKNFIRDNFKSGKLEILTKKPITAGLKEIEENPRSRSAKLRAAKII